MWGMQRSARRVDTRSGTRPRDSMLHSYSRLSWHICFVFFFFYYLQSLCGFYSPRLWVFICVKIFPTNIFRWHFQSINYTIKLLATKKYILSSRWSKCDCEFLFGAYVENKKLIRSCQNGYWSSDIVRRRASHQNHTSRGSGKFRKSYSIGWNEKSRKRANTSRILRDPGGASVRMWIPLRDQISKSKGKRRRGRIAWIENETMTKGDRARRRARIWIRQSGEAARGASSSCRSASTSSSSEGWIGRLETVLTSRSCIIHQTGNHKSLDLHEGDISFASQAVLDIHGRTAVASQRHLAVRTVRMAKTSCFSTA